MNGATRQLDLFFDRPLPESVRPIQLDDLFEAYAACRRHKRRTASAMAFELNYEENLVELCREINSGQYMPGQSVAFIVDRPVKREIFAAQFRDRVVHHLLINKLNALFERSFIYDSYSCREGKGTHLGIRRLGHSIRSCSGNYSRECWVLKLDIRGFFMSISRRRLYDMLEEFLNAQYREPDLPAVLALCRKVVFLDPAANCVIKCKRSDWDGLPPDKSLFHAKPGCGLPIGNLTSQIFANFYLNGFDHFMKHDLGLQWYGRYVDDFFVVHEDRRFLAELVPVLREYLARRLGLSLHPRKIVLEECSRGVGFLGVVLKPRRTYIANRTKGNMYRAIMRHNRVAEDHRPNHRERAGLQSSINSYLGLMRHYNTYRLRHVMIYSHLSQWWLRLLTPDASLHKLSLVHNPRRRIR